MVLTNEIVPASRSLPKQLLIYPIEQKVIFPGMLSQTLTNRTPLMQLVDRSIETNRLLGMVLVKNTEEKNPYRFSNMYRVGVAVKIHKKLNLPEGGYNLFLMVLERFIIRRELRYTFPLIAEVEYIEEDNQKNKEITALTRSLIGSMKKILENNPIFSEEVRLNMVNVDAPGQIADFLTAILDLKKEQQQDILETFSLQQRLEKVLVFVSRELELLKIQERIHSQINDSVETHRRNHFLKEMLKEIKKELGEPVDGKTSELQMYREKVAALPLPERAREQLHKEIQKLESIETYHPEYGILVGYLERVTDLPWAEPEKKDINIAFTQKVLDKDHYGMEKVKQRIVEHLAVSKIPHSKAKSILCLVGPPGVGKTSIASSIARALKRKTYHFSVGGMHDEAEIKGHRRTYIGAMPGKIIQGLLYVKEKDPIFIIDEIDKLSRGPHGDPSSALLEVLDPVQNTQFRDLYLDIPFDLSHIFFITTANTLHTIPVPLRNRMEILELSGYIDEEKLSIARKYIVPKSLKKHGIPKSSISFPIKTLKTIATRYAREAGMRRFEQYVDTIIRKVVTKNIDRFAPPSKQTSKKDGTPPAVIPLSEHTTEKKEKFSQKITSEDLEHYLGIAPFQENITKRASVPGTAIGLAWTSQGGDILVVEASSYPGKGNFVLTGTLGDVMKESARIALSLVKHYRSLLPPSRNATVGDASMSEHAISKHDIHLHVPAGATPKDGPSAGIALASALLSLFLNKTIRSNFSMTGELSLVGRVLPIGGLREKIVATRRNKIKNVIIPKGNTADLKEIPDYIKQGVTIHLVSTIGEVFDLLFPSVTFSHHTP